MHIIQGFRAIPDLIFNHAQHLRLDLQPDHYRGTLAAPQIIEDPLKLWLLVKQPENCRLVSRRSVIQPLMIRATFYPDV